MARRARKLSGKMSDDKLKSIIQAEIKSAIGSSLTSDGAGDLSESRREALQFYLSDPMGNEVEGRSQAIDSVVHDVVESALPGLVEIFLSSDDIVRFEPVGPEDEAAAKQATEYVNHVLMRDNPGFRVIYNWLKDGLLQKNGIVKVFWEETDATKRETFTNLSDIALAQLLSDDTVEAVEHTDRGDGFHDLTILREYKKGGVRWVNVPPEEFLVARRATSLDDAPFAAHKVRKTVSELIEEGFDRSIVENLPSDEGEEYTEEHLARSVTNDDFPDSPGIDPSMRRVWVTECYLKTDYDGDGVAELRCVTVAGPGAEILANDPVDDMPFADWCPIPMPHEFFGLSLADETMDLQVVKSQIWRQLIDNISLSNNARTAINERVNLDDLLVNRVGGVVRVEGMEPVGDSISPMQTPGIAHQAYPLLEYVDSLREQRTGITRYNQGLDADSLNKTATGINQIMGQAQKRQQLIARMFAENGLKRAVRLARDLIMKHQDADRVVRLRNEWVAVDPKSWNADFDMTINVGIGHGTKETQLVTMQQTIQMQSEIAAFQGGLDGPLVTAKNIAAAFRKWLEAAGMKDTEAYISDPDMMPPKEPQQDPEAMEKQAKIQIEQQRLQLDGQKHQDDTALRSKEIELKYGLEQQKLGFEGRRLQTDMQMQGAKMNLDREKMATERQFGEQDRNLRRAEMYGMEDGTGFEDLKAVAAMLQNIGEALNTQNSAIVQIATRVSEIEEDLDAPKQVRVVRSADGRIKGATVNQGSRKTEVSLN